MSDIDTSNPLDVDLSKVPTGFPLIESGALADFKVVKASLTANGAHTVAVELESLDTLPGKTDGETLKAGSKLFGNINTEPTGASTWDIIKRSTGEFIQAFGLSWTIRDLRTNCTDLQGKTVRVRVGIQPEGTGKDGVFRKARNTVAEWIKKSPNTN